MGTSFFEIMDANDLKLLNGKISSQELKELPLRIAKLEIKEIDDNEYSE